MDDLRVLLAMYRVMLGEYELTTGDKKDLAKAAETIIQGTNPKPRDI